MAQIDDDGIDRIALRSGRRQKTLAAMRRAGVEAVLLTKAANVEYATGVAARRTDASLEAARGVAAFMTGDGATLISASDPGIVPATPEFTHSGIGVGFDAPASLARFVGACRERAGRVDVLAVDRLSAGLRVALDSAFPRARLVDADTMLAPEKMVKTPEEIACLARAQALNEAAMEVVVPRIVPGVSEVELTGVFMAAMTDRGVSACHVEPVWCVLPRTAAAAPWTFAGGPPYRELTGDRRLAAGDLVAIDTGILYEGYMSDFGRTWYCSAGTARPSPAERALFERWRDIVAAVIDVCRPGRTAADLRRAARRLDGGEPWPRPLYLAHGIGLGGVEAPFVGTDLGEAAEDAIGLVAGMVIVVEPYVWSEGVGGYRGEESILIDPSGPTRLSHFAYGAFDAA